VFKSLGSKYSEGSMYQENWNQELKHKAYYAHSCVCFY